MPAARRSAAGTKAARFMLDTDTCSYIMKRSHPLVLKRLQTFSVDDVCMSVVTKAELLYGVEVSPRRAHDAAALAAFLPYVEAVDLDAGAALHYAEIRADLKRRGVMIGANDLFIAAHARALGLTLVTNNTAEFERVRDLKLDNWTLPARRSPSSRGTSSSWPRRSLLSAFCSAGADRSSCSTPWRAYGSARGAKPWLRSCSQS